MKKWSKLLALFVAAAMTLSLTLFALADEGSPSADAVSEGAYSEQMEEAGPAPDEGAADLEESAADVQDGLGTEEPALDESAGDELESDEPEQGEQGEPVQGDAADVSAEPEADAQDADKADEPALEEGAVTSLDAEPLEGGVTFVPVSAGNEYDVQINGVGPVITIYCLQQKYRWPYDDEQVVYYDRFDASDEFVYAGLLSDYEIEVIRNLVFAGYPNDSQGIFRSNWIDDPEMAGGLTNNAIWALMAEWGKPGSRPSSAIDYDNADPEDFGLQLMIQLINYAKSADGVTLPAADDIVIEGDVTLYKHPSDGTYSTGDLMITHPEGLNLLFSLSLPDGVYAEDEYGFQITEIGEYETFRIVAESAEAAESFQLGISSVLKYPGEVSFYVTNQKTGVYDQVDKVEQQYQTMLYVPDYSMSLARTFSFGTGELGSLTVSKTLAGDDCDYNRDFSFTITLSDSSINGTFGGVTFENGVATIVLKGDESETIEGLPAGVGYTVEEADYSADGYELTSKTGDTGTISKTEGSVAAFTNTHNTFGYLTVSKTLVSDHAIDADKAFSFTVELSDKTITGKYGDMEFADGVATFELKDGESVTAEGLPNGVDYIVTEADYEDDGFVTTVPENHIGSIAGGQTASVAFVNTREPDGSLTIVKTLEGNDVDHDATFMFTVDLYTAQGAPVNGTFGDVTFEDGYAIVYLKGGESKTIEGLPSGVRYKVVEWYYEDAGYELTHVVDDEGTISSDAACVASFTNTRNTYGDLTVTKTVEGNAGDADEAFAFTVELSDKAVSGTFGQMTFQNGVATFELKHGESITAEGLPNGVGYVVSEKDHYAAEGYETTASGDTGTIDSKQAATAAFTNTRNTYGSLRVVKKVDGNAGDTDKAFTFTVELGDKTVSGEFGDMTFENGIATFELAHHEHAVATGLPNGVAYTVTEANYEADGYVNTKKSGDEGTIVGNDELTAEFTNTRNADGSLTVSKVLEGNDVDADKEFSFTVRLADTSVTGTYGDVTFEAGVATVTLKGGESKVIEGLPNGTTYSVHEADYEAEGYELYSKTGEVGIISEHHACVAVFTNYRDTFGDLTVTKAVEGNAYDADMAFAFTVELGDKTISGEFGDITFENGIATFELKGGESVTAEGLPNGMTYTVTEANYAREGYETVKSGDEGAIVGDDELVASFVNTRNAEGSLTVSKALEGNDVDADKEFSFTVTLSDTTVSGEFGGVAFENGVATVTLKGGESKVIEGLPNGTGYTVEEADYTADGYELTSKTGDTGTISETEARVASFTNTRNTYGDLTVTKTVAGNAADADKAFSFTVTLSDTTVSGTFGEMNFVNGVATFELKGGEAKTAADLPNGVAYTVAEANYTTDGYVTVASGDKGTIDSKQTAVAAFTNTRNAEGSLTISKTLTGNDVDAAKVFTFTVTLSDTAVSGEFSGVAFENGVATVTLKGGESKVIEGLPNGVIYKVVEADYKADGYELVGSDGTTGTISETAACVASFTNTRNTYGGLTVTKTVAGKAGDKDKGFVFTVTLSDKTVSGTFGEMHFVNGIAKFDLKHGGSKTATGLPNGVTYTVTENDYKADGYTTTVSGGQGAIEGGKTATAAFTNTKDTATPEHAVPKTGDDTNQALWTTLMVVGAALVVLAGTVLFGVLKKRKSH